MRLLGSDAETSRNGGAAGKGRRKPRNENTTWVYMSVAVGVTIVMIVAYALTLSSLPRDALRASFAYHLEQYRLTSSLTQRGGTGSEGGREVHEDETGAPIEDADWNRASAREETRPNDRAPHLDVSPECDMGALLSAREHDGTKSIREKKAVVFLHSHGRSGSTLASSLFFSTTNIFFLDEPLREDWRVEIGLRNVDRAVMMTRCEFNVGGGDWETPVQQPTDVKSFVANEANRISKNSYSHIEERPPWLRGVHKGITESVAKSVLRNMQWYCRASEITAMKEVRLMRACDGEANSLRYLLTKYDEAKVVHLVRHPHEVVQSQYVNTIDTTYRHISTSSA